MEALNIAKKPEGVAAELCRAILAGTVAGGTEVTQNELAESLGVSRMPVREALIMLEYQGLVERLANQHIKVAAVTESYFKGIFSLAAALESEACTAQAASGIAAADERAFHESLLKLEKNPLRRRTLKTLVMVFVPFALGSAAHDGAAAVARLSAALGAAREGRAADARAELDAYFARLATDAWERRRAQ